MKEMDSDSLEHLKKILMSGCAGCGKPIGDDCAFCGFCGTENQQFSGEAFRKVWEGMTLADRRKQSCKTGHAEMREAVRLHPDLPYCEDCGEKLM